MKNILFIGNSYTFFNDMPSLFEDLAKENGQNCKVTSVTKGGRKLFHNTEKDDEFATLIKETASNSNYYAIFLQDQSLIAIDSPDDFKKGISSHITLFKADRYILYSTWGRKEGSDKLTERSLTSGEMTALIAKSYAEAAKENNAEVSNVGLAFKYISDNYPDIELYNPDLSHPSYDGSCLAAMVHYYSVFGELPTHTSSLELSDEKISAFISAVKKSSK